MTSKAMKGLGVASAIVAFLVAQFWGVPYYIKVAVAEEVKTISENASTLPEVTALSDKVIELEGRLTPVESAVVRIDGTTVRIEGKIDDLSGLFVGYLERQANRE